MTAVRSACLSAAILLVAGALHPALAQSRAAEFRRIRAADIQARIVGRDITDDFHWTEYYRRDGVLQMDGMGRRSAGRWKVERDRLCILRPALSIAFECFEVWVRGDEVSLRMEADADSPAAFIRPHRGG